jgi:hypothetical protein
VCPPVLSGVSAEVVRVGVDREEEGHTNEKGGAWTKNPVNLLQRAQRIGDVLEEFRAEDSVEGTCAKRDALGVTDNIGMLRRGEIEVYDARVVHADVERAALVDFVAAEIEDASASRECGHMV